MSFEKHFSVKSKMISALTQNGICGVDESPKTQLNQFLIMHASGTDITVCLVDCLSTCLSLCLYVCLFLHLFAYLPACLSLSSSLA